MLVHIAFNQPGLCVVHGGKMCGTEKESLGRKIDRPTIRFDSFTRERKSQVFKPIVSYLEDRIRLQNLQQRSLKIH